MTTLYQIALTLARNPYQIGLLMRLAMSVWFLYNTSEAVPRRSSSHIEEVSMPALFVVV